jgi:small GTP-binding protein
MSEAPLMKVFIAGEGGVGKSSMVERFVKGVFNPNMIMTIGVSHSVKFVTASNGKKVELQIWDLGGEDRFRFVVPAYIKGSTAGLVVFDTTRYSTYKNLEREWMELIRDNLPDTPIILIGAKMDSGDSNNDPESYEELMKKFHVDEILFTSAKTGENVEKVFKRLADLTLQSLEDDYYSF